MESLFKQEALNIINELIQTINWLGGDGYEMDAISPVLRQAENFLEKHEEKKPVPVEIKYNHWNNLYFDLDNPENKVYAKNKKHARNLLNIPRNRVKYSQPKDILILL